MVPGLSWAFVPATTGPQLDASTNVTSYPLIVNSFALWAQSCDEEGMDYTYNSALCATRYQVVQAFSLLAVVFSALAVIFGLMPFSPVAPRDPKRSLTHAMLCQMFTGLFALISFAVFYGGLVNGVFAQPNPDIPASDYSTGKFSSVQGWQSPGVAVTSGGIVAVAAWSVSFFAWMLSLAAMIQYDASAAERAVVMHRNRKEERERRRADLIARLGEGAIRAAEEGIALDLGDKLYLGGTIVSGGATALAWMNMGLAPILMLDFHAISQTVAAVLIINSIATTTGTMVLCAGLVDLIPRPKASVGGFSVLSVVSALWLANYGMALHVLRAQPFPYPFALPYEASVGTIGIAAAVSAVALLYHPFKIWEQDVAELPRPAKRFKGADGLALVVAGSMFALVGWSMACAASTVFLYDGTTFLEGIRSQLVNTTSSSSCANRLGSVCNVGDDAQRCCPSPFQCVESAFTQFTCQNVADNWLPSPPSAFPVAQAFVALEIGVTTLSFVFFVVALAPNGVMDTKVALAVAFSTAAAGAFFAMVAFGVLQGYYIANGGVAMPAECGYLLGSVAICVISAGLGFSAWRPYRRSDLHDQAGYDPTAAELERARRLHEIERLRFEAAKYCADRQVIEAELVDAPKAPALDGDGAHRSWGGAAARALPREVGGGATGGAAAPASASAPSGAGDGGGGRDRDGLGAAVVPN